MADNKRWFKVWTTLILDKINEELTFEEIGLFTLLGCLIAQKGDNGKLIVSCKLFKTLFDNEKLPQKFIQKFNVEIVQNDNDTLSVSLKNWHKFQKDSTGYERLKSWRKRQNETTNDNGDKIRKDKIRKDKIKEENIYTPEFDAFYKSYPNKTAKPSAFKAWQKINPVNGIIEKIMTGLEKWKESPKWKKDNGEFIPHPSTWLNQCRWEDDIPQAPKKWNEE